MSAASPATSQVRHPTAAVTARPMTSQPPAARPSVRSAPVHSFVSADVGDGIRINLSDIPRFEESMDIEGLQPSLLSRLFDFVAPLNKR